MSELNVRQREIVERLRETGQQSINELADLYGVATQTIRRDTNALCDQGLARRVHGGVAPPANPVNLNFRARSILNEAPKRAISAAAAAMVPPGSTVLLGIGTTVQYTAEALMQTPDITLVTNNLEVASLMCGVDHNEVHLVGGQLRAEDRDLVGPGTLDGYRRFVADFGIVSCGALDPDHGVLDYKQFDADVSNTIRRAARQHLLLADDSKWQNRARHRVYDFHTADHFITNRLPDQATWDGCPVRLV
ncbi:DeoR/GlpR family DNA-binding transcription regulator [Epibacterium ulvae]|uniref:DeoR/GlpR family DNA-binding transcription regulator n=1 Tax=Epibacterium ulvae TaxID=1156985 RepID=UPI001BFC7884|nr:DeoR/GlpR family DNA-binding transcription regulator [Epibacterium ulvae]MBT8153321.1 DeoR/GlpR family DNA-binding transcription regulator [Epibacterium ulvae]